MLPDSPKCAALRADMRGNRLNSRSQHVHKNESIKAHGIVQEESVIIQDKILFKQILINGNKISMMIDLY